MTLTLSQPETTTTTTARGFGQLPCPMCGEWGKVAVELAELTKGDACKCLECDAEFGLADGAGATRCLATGASVDRRRAGPGRVNHGTEKMAKTLGANSPQGFAENLPPGRRKGLSNPLAQIHAKVSPSNSSEATSPQGVSVSETPSPGIRRKGFPQITLRRICLKVSPSNPLG